MILGFTGTRAGMTGPQRDALLKLVVGLDVTLHLNGACRGADREVAEIIVMAFPTATIEFYPGSSEQSAWTSSYCEGLSQRLVVHPIQDYLARNRVIVDRCMRFLAAPKEQASFGRGGGTWSTVRYARKIGKPITIVYPDGAVREHEK